MCVSILFSNIIICAVDNMLEGLVKVGVNALRIGRPESTRPELLRYSLQAIVDQALGLGGGGPGSGPRPVMGKEMKQMKHDAMKRALGNAQVICATCVGAGECFQDYRVHFFSV